MGINVITGSPGNSGHYTIRNHYIIVIVLPTSVINILQVSSMEVGLRAVNEWLWVSRARPCCLDWILLRNRETSQAVQCAINIMHLVLFVY